MVHSFLFALIVEGTKLKPSEHWNTVPGCSPHERQCDLPLGPPKLAESIAQALEKDRKLRYQTAGGILADLKRLMRDLDTESKAVEAAEAAAKPKEELDASAVLPFENSSGDPDSEYLGARNPWRQRRGQALARRGPSATGLVADHISDPA